MKKHSVKTTFTLVFVAIIAALLVVLYLFNRFFLQAYYENEKVRVMSLASSTLDKMSVLANKNETDIIDYIASVYDTNEDDSPTVSILRTLNEGSNIDITLMSSDRKKTLSTSREANWTAYKLFAYVTLYDGDIVISDSGDPGYMGSLRGAAEDFSDITGEVLQGAGLLGRDQHYKFIKSTDSYTMHKVSDARSGEEYIECFGRLSDGDTFFLMSSPLSNIAEGARTASRFVFMTGIITLIIGSVIMYLVVSRLTKPLMKLAGLSDRMTKLDFSEKYDGNENNEIGVLGSSMNSMSEMLEAYICELKNANEMLQADLVEKVQIDDARKEFIANVSHELKTPIALIESYAEGLSEGLAETAEMRDYYCSVIIDESFKMNKLVRDLTALINYEFGSDKAECTDFDLCELVRSVAESMQVRFDEAGALVSLDLPEHAAVSADEFKIEEVFTNYLANALNHLSGEKHIAIRIEEDESWVRTYVYNDGDPIPEESIPHIWEKFYKADKARSRAYGGSGIGLSIVRAVMDMHCGKYGVRNTENGVEFMFALRKPLTAASDMC